jgi:hypothetical protein
LKHFVLLFAALLLGCPAGGAIPSDNVSDYRITFREAEATGSCSDDAIGTADAWEERSLVYRVHWVDGPTEPRVDLYWRNNGDNDADFRWFGSGNLEGTLESGVFVYAGRGFREERSTGSVYFDIEGRAPVRFADEIASGTEEYVVVEPSNAEGYVVGCVFTLRFDGAALNENAEG